MTKLGNKPFTIVHIEDSNYTQGEEVTEGVKITTKESFAVEGFESTMSKFHTTRIAIVRKLSNEKLRGDINSGKQTLKVKCVMEKTSAGKDFFNLVDA